MRVLLALLLVFSSLAWSGETAGSWLDQAADATLTLRQREYAAKQVLMLADSSASILIAAVKGDGSDSGLRRQVAAGLLGELGIATSEAALLEAAFDQEYFLAEAAAAALSRLYARLGDAELYTLYRRGGRERNTVPGGIGQGDDWLVLSLNQAEHRSRFRSIVMRAIASKYKRESSPMPAPLVQCVWDGLLDANRDVRLYAAEAAPLTNSSSAPERLASFLYAENDAKLLIRALRSMGEMRTPDFGEAVLRHTAHDNPAVAVEALAALDAMGYDNTLFPVMEGQRSVAGFVVHPSTPVRKRAVEVLAASKNPAALPYLTQALFDRVGPNRAAAAEALGELGFPGAAGALSPLLNDGRPEVRQAAALALTRLGVVGVSARVLDDLNSDDLIFRRAAARALGDMGSTQAVVPLSNVLGDEDAELVCLAADALGKLADPAAGPALYTLMTTTGDPVMRDAARQALAKIYRDDPGESASYWESWEKRNTIRR